MKRSDLNYIDSWVEYQFTQAKIPGLAVCIIDGQNIIYERALGYSNLQRNETLSPAHLFRVASLTKMITAIGIMQLVERGKLGLDDEVSAHLSFSMSNVTIRQLLSHTSGFSRDGLNASFFANERAFPDFHEIQNLIETGGNIIKCNTRYKYSNFGFSLLGKIIEEATSQSYEEYVKNNIFSVENSDQLILDPNDSIQLYASGYSVASDVQDQFELPFNIKTNAFVPAAGLSASAAALSQLYKHLYYGDNALISDVSKKEMFRCQWEPNQNDPSDYGLGFLLEKIGKHSYVGHAGGFPGYVSKVMIEPQHQYLVCVLTNTSKGTAIPLTNSLCSLVQLFKSREVSPCEDDILEKFTGRYYCLWGVYDFIPVGNKVYVSQPSNGPNFQTAFHLSHLEGNTFEITEDHGTGHFGEQVTFHFEKDGTIERVSFVGLNLYPADKIHTMMTRMRR